MNGTSRARRDERGVAMMMTVIVIVVAASLAALVLMQGSSTERRSGRGANWNEALHIAEAGVDQAIASLQANNGLAPAPFTGTTTEGSYKVSVSYLGRGKYQIDSVGVAGTAQGLQTTRSLRVVMAPPVSFEYALFSLTDVNTKNNDIVNGDIWANGSVIVDQNDEVYGSITAATGTVEMRNGSKVFGDIVSGGYNASGVAMDLRSVTGNVKASSTSPGCVDDPGHGQYKIVNGTVTGNATTWAANVGSGVTGTKTTHACTQAPATKPIPTFTYNPLHYDPNPKEYTSPSAFHAYLSAGNKTTLSGVHFVDGGGTNDPVDLTGVKIVGDTTIIAIQAPIWANGVEAANNSDKLLVLVSYYQPPAGTACTDTGGNPGDCAVGMKNNFQPSDNTATLIYTPNGPVAFKNNAEFVGAVYGNDIVVKNNMVITYDDRVSQIIGFGTVTLTRESWIEL